MADYYIRGWAKFLAILFAIVIEFYMIVVETYVNFQTAFGVWGGAFVYVFVSLFSIIFLKLVFMRVNAARFAKTYVMTLLIVLPIGFFWGIFQGYDINSQLFNIDWQFTHDMVYTVIVTQFVVLALLLLGTRKTDDGDYVEKGDVHGEWSTGWD